jgi:hypothetical protein
MAGWRAKVLWAALLLAVLAAYSNHFQNGFHFDDWHTIAQNPYIRDLKYIPTFFTDARTQTVHPPNQIYRPLVSTMLAIDYWAAGGLDTTWYHVDVFLFSSLLGDVAHVLAVGGGYAGHHDAYAAIRGRGMASSRQRGNHELPVPARGPVLGARGRGRDRDVRGRATLAALGSVPGSRAPGHAGEADRAHVRADPLRLRLPLRGRLGPWAGLARRWNLSARSSRLRAVCSYYLFRHGLRGVAEPLPHFITG